MEGIASDTYMKEINPTNIDELALVKGAIKGKKEDFLLLINKNKSYLYKTAYLYVKNNEDALDIYQETVYKAYLSIGKLKKPQHFKTWITRILINNAKDKLIEIKCNDKYVEIDRCSDVENIGEEVSIEEKIDLYNAIDSLEEKYRTPIILNYFQGITTKEIGEVLKIPENTVKSYIRRGKAALLESLREEE
ncbi:MAG: sigma-70 family RNA polymerase sigma factor [Clostridium sp.]